MLLSLVTIESILLHNISPHWLQGRGGSRRKSGQPSGCGRGEVEEGRGEEGKKEMTQEKNKVKKE